MIKWKNKLAKAALLALGVVLLGNTAGLSVLASESSPSNTPAADSGKSVIISFDSLENNSLELPVNGRIEDIRNQFPARLTGTRVEASNGAAVSGTADSITGASSIIHVMTQNYAEGNGEANIEIAFNGWELRNGGSLDSSKIGEIYEYVPVLLKRDNSGNPLTYLNRPVVTVTIVPADAEEEDAGISAYSENDSNGGIMTLADDDTGFTVNVGDPTSGSGEAAGLWIAFQGPKKPEYNSETGSFTLDTTGNTNFYITGNWNSVLTDKKGGNDIITVTGNGTSKIWLDNVNINVSKDAVAPAALGNKLMFSSVFVIKSGATVDMRVISTRGETQFICEPNNDVGQQALNVEGTLNLLQGNLVLNGLFTNGSAGKVTIGGSQNRKAGLTSNCVDTVNVPVVNEGALTVKYNGTMDVKGDVKNGKTFKIDGSTKDVPSTVTVDAPKVYLEKIITNDGEWIITDTQNVYVKDEIINNSAGKIKVTSNSALNVGTANGTDYNTNCKIQNVGEFIIEGNSVLQGSGTVTNDGTLSIDAKTCLNNGISLAAGSEECKFIFKGVPDDILGWKDNKEPLLSYTGESQRDKIFSENGKEGALVVNETTKVQGMDFTIAANKRVSTELYRLNEANNQAELVQGTNPEKVLEPGRYVIICQNQDKEGQEAHISFTMKTWSMEMIFTSEKSAEPVGPDDYATENKPDIDAVFEHGSQIRVKVKVAIFPQSGNDGFVKLEHDICTGLNGDSTPKYDTYTHNLPVKLAKNTGCGTVEAIIYTGDAKTRMPVPYTEAIDSTKVAPSAAEADTDSAGNVHYREEIPYNYPYNFTATYVGNSAGSIYQEPVYTTDINRKVEVSNRNEETWKDEKKVVVKRAKVRVTFGENYYKNSAQYNREKLENPDTFDQKSIIFEGADAANVKVDYVWYKESEAARNILEGKASGNLKDYYAVLEDYAEKQTAIDKTLANYGEEKYLVAGGPPRDAGNYFVQAIVRETCRTVESWNTHPVTITPAPLKMQAIDQQKAYGEKDPEWDIVIETTSDRQQTVSIQGTVYEGDSLNGCRLTRKEGEDQGSYDIGKENGFFNPNYDVDFKGSRLTIMPRDLEWDAKKTILAVDKNNLNKLYGGLQVTYASHGAKDPSAEYSKGIAKLFANDIGSGKLKVTYKAVTLDTTGNAIGSFATIGGVSLSGEAAKNYTLPIDNRVSLDDANKNYELQINKVSALSGEDYGNYGKEVMSALLVYGGIKNTGEIETRLKDNLKTWGVAEENMELYDIVIRQKDSTILKDITELFPGTLTLIMPYPTGTGSTGWFFYAGHMLTKEMRQLLLQPGDIENPTVSATDAGVQFTLTSLSPVSLGWTAGRTSQGGNSGGNTNNPGGTNNGTNTNGTNNGSNSTNNTNNSSKATSSNTNTSNNNSSKATSSTTTKTTGTTGTTSKTGSSGSGTTASSTITRALGAVTGDNAPIVLYAVLTFVGMLLLLFIILMLKKTFSGKK